MRRLARLLGGLAILSGLVGLTLLAARPPADEGTPAVSLAQAPSQPPPPHDAPSFAPADVPPPGEAEQPTIEPAPPTPIGADGPSQPTPTVADVPSRMLLDEPFVDNRMHWP